MRRAQLLLGAVLLIVLAGCSDTDPGSPVAGGTSEPTSTRQPTSTTEPTSEPPTSTSASSRPKPIDLAGVDMCQVLKQVRPQDFGIDFDGDGLGGDSDVFSGSKDCFANGLEANLGLTLTGVTSEGFDSYTGSVNADVTPGQAAGYPLAVLRSRRSASFCFAVVDVADGQMLHVSFGVTNEGRQPVTPQDTLCQAVPKIAEAAMAVLVG